MVQNLCDAAKALLRGKFITIQIYLKKQENSQRNNLISYLKQRQKEQQAKSKISRWKDIIKIRAEINKIEAYKIIATIS